jgi:rubrerythrin
MMVVAERIAVDHYLELVRYFGDDDPTTRVMLEGILGVEEEHANDMHDLLLQQCERIRLPRFDASRARPRGRQNPRIAERGETWLTTERSSEKGIASGST